MIGMGRSNAAFIGNYSLADEVLRRPASVLEDFEEGSLWLRPIDGMPVCNWTLQADAHRTHERSRSPNFARVNFHLFALVSDSTVVFVPP